MTYDGGLRVTVSGYTEVGKVVIQQSAHHVKRLSLELGGQAAFIILDDANLERAVQGVMGSKFRNAGQTCICANRIYVQSGVYDDFVSAFRQAVSHLKVGNGLDEATDIGTLVNEAGVEKVSAHVDDALRKGASIVYGG